MSADQCMLAGGWFHEGCLGVDIVVALLSKLTLTHGDLRDSRCECVQHVNACELHWQGMALLQ